MGLRDKAAAAFFVVMLLAGLGTVGYIVGVSRAERAAEEAKAPAPRGGRDEALIAGLVEDFGRAVQRGEADAACVLLAGEAFADFDCRFGRQDIPRRLAIPDGARIAVGDVVVQGDEALTQLRGGSAPQAVRLQRQGRRWRIIRVGLPTPS
jgi:hypothetical protein